MSATFPLHSLRRLRDRFGIRDDGFDRIASFRTVVCSRFSTVRRASVTIWPYQWPVLRPVVFLLYEAELFDVAAEYGFTTHSYTDDTHIYISTPASDYDKAPQRLHHQDPRMDGHWPVIILS